MVLVLKIAGFLYKIKLREVLIDFINDPNNDWDDKLIKALDEFFNYTSEESK